MITAQCEVGQTIWLHCFADENTEAESAQWLAEGQLVNQGQGKAKPTSRFSTSKSM